MLVANDNTRPGSRPSSRPPTPTPGSACGPITSSRKRCVTAGGTLSLPTSGAARVLDETGQRIAKLSSIVVEHFDPVVNTTRTEFHRLRRFGAVKIVNHRTCTSEPRAILHATVTR
jgi:hypothetical protein